MTSLLEVAKVGSNSGWRELEPHTMKGSDSVVVALKRRRHANFLVFTKKQSCD